jgi:hypothetical protein
MHPYKNDAINKIYDLLFCDQPELYATDAESSDEALQQMASDNTVEARQRAVAAHILKQRGKPDTSKQLFGVIVEVGMDEGLDVLAAYADRTARYINYSEKLIIWETRTSASDELIDDLLAAATSLVEQIGPWDGERLPPPVVGNARVSMLVSDGLYFGEGPFEALAGDGLGGPVLKGAAKLMGFLIENVTDQSP